MFIMSFPWQREKLRDLCFRHDVFYLLMKESTQASYLVLRDNTVTWLAQGTIPSKTAYQIRSRSATMNGSTELPVTHGNVGFLGNYSNIEDAVQKLFPHNGYCVSNMKFQSYTGQKLKTHKYHYSVIEPLLCLLDGNSDSMKLESFFRTLRFPDCKLFQYSGDWNGTMQLFINSEKVETLERWFSYFCSITLR